MSQLRQTLGKSCNTEDIIEAAYDLQAGSYVTLMQNPIIAEYKDKYTSELVKQIKLFCNPKTILEAGVGGATTLSYVIKKLGSHINYYGLDISQLQLNVAKDWLLSQGIAGVLLCKGSLGSIPFDNNSIDIVYTSHSIEPNSGREKQIIMELYRIAKCTLILLEPSYELASTEGKKRMESMCYCKNTFETCKELKYNIIKHELYPHIINPLNPTAITVIKKGTN